MSLLTRLRKDFLSVLDFDPADFDRCLDVAAQLKADRPLRREAPSADVLAGRHVGMLFEKASLRTRSTFEIAIHELGGQVLVLGPDAVTCLQRSSCAALPRVNSRAAAKSGCGSHARSTVVSPILPRHSPATPLRSCMSSSGAPDRGLAVTQLR